MNLMQTLFLPCRKATELMERRTVASLPPVDVARLWMHQRICKACLVFAKQSHAIDMLLEQRGMKGSVPDTSVLEERIIETVPERDAR